MRCALRGGGDLDAADDDDADAAPAVAFLYTLAPGVAPRSYGLHVASLAGLPKRLVRAAAERAAQLEARLAGAFAAASHADGALGADAAAALRAAVAATQPDAPPAALRDAWRDAVQLTL
jgi:DNA mismatch repair ATPase MutS